MQTESGIHDLISSRRSIRSFSDQPVDDGTLIRLFEAARWASSSRNEQPWRFIVAKKSDETFITMLECLNESNRVWSARAAFLFIVLAKRNFTQRPSLNTHSAHDVGLAIGNLSLQATASGIFLRQMGGLLYEKVREVFEIPEEFEVISIIAGGYPGPVENLPENLRAREMMPRERKPLRELIFEKKFGQPSSIFP